MKLSLSTVTLSLFIEIKVQGWIGFLLQLIKRLDVLQYNKVIFLANTSVNLFTFSFVYKENCYIFCWISETFVALTETFPSIFLPSPRLFLAFEMKKYRAFQKFFRAFCYLDRAFSEPFPSLFLPSSRLFLVFEMKKYRAILKFFQVFCCLDRAFSEPFFAFTETFPCL